MTVTKKDPVLVVLQLSGGNDFMMRPYVDEEFYCRVNQNLDTLDQIKSARRWMGSATEAKVA